MISINWRW